MTSAVDAEWSWVSGSAQIYFYDAGPFPSPANIYASNTASSGRFVGDFNAAGADAFGFDFIADIGPPAALVVYITDEGENTFSLPLAIPPNEQLESFFIPLDTKASAGWLGVPDNSEARFSTMRTNVKNIRIFITKSLNPPEQILRFDNFFLAQTFQWDGGTNGLGTNWLSSTNWFPNGIPGVNSRVVFASTGAATVVNVDSYQATGGVLQVGQLFCSVSNRTFEASSTATNSKMQFNGYGGVFVSAGSNTVTFRNGPVRQLELVAARYRGSFDVAAGGAIIVSNCVISETNVSCRVDKTGEGLLHLGASNKFSGGARVLGGVLRVGHTNALGPGGLRADGGRLDLNGFAVTLSKLSGATGVVSDASAGVATNTITLNQNTNTLFTGMLSNGTDKIVALVKNGTGTLVIAGTNLNSGTMLINTGRLLMAANGIGASNVWRIGELGPGRLIVSTGAVFGGAGRVRGLVDNGGLVLPGTGTLICAGDYLQRSNAALTFMLGGTNAAINQTQFTDKITTNVSGSVTNIFTNTVVQTELYSRMEVNGTATLDGLLRVQLVNGFVPAIGDIFDVMVAPFYSGLFSTNSLKTNNLPALTGGKEWSLRYTESGVSLACVTSGSPVIAYVASSIAFEGNGGLSNLSFVVTLSKAATATVSLAWSTSNGTAVAGSDYIATNGLLTINAGSFIGLINVPVIGDTTYEFNETIKLHLTAATNTLIGASQGTGYIFNDDPLPVITIGSVTTNEDASFNLPVTLSAPMALPATFTFATANGTALAGSDYSATSGTFVISGGTTSTVLNIPVTPDALYESNETMTVSFGPGINSTLGTAQVLLTLLNDDPVPTLSHGIVIQSEGDVGTRNFVFPVYVSNPSIHPIHFGLTTTTNGSATPGSDYWTTNASYTLASGVVSASFTVVVISDINTEPNETFVVQFSYATNATIGGSGGSATILDDDFNPYPGFLGFVQQIPDGQQRGYFDDPDLDGQLNIYEFAFLSNPNDIQSLGKFFPAVQSGIPGLRFGRNVYSAEISIEVEAAERILETITPGIIFDPEEPPLPPTTNSVIWYTFVTNTAGVWTGSVTVTESGTNNPVATFIPDPDLPGITNRFYRVRVLAPP